jgi:putative transposase
MTESDESATILRAYRFNLDPNQNQLSALAQHAGTARWAFNHALAVKIGVHQTWRDQVQALVDEGLDEQVARKQVSIKIPTAFTMKSAWIKIRGDEKTGEDGASPWWRTVSSYTFSSAFSDADAAFKNWMNSLTGKRKGRKMGYPKFKKKGRSRDSFRIYHDVKSPTIRPDGYRHLLVPRLGSLRLHSSAKRLVRALSRGARIQSVALSRGASQWYAAVLVKEPAEHVLRPTTRAQRVRGAVGVDVGLLHLAAYSDGTLINNPRFVRAAAARLRTAQRRLSRTERGSARRHRAAVRVGRIHHQVAEQRASFLHGLTKNLATQYERVAIEDLNVLGMTASARGTVEKPGKNVRAKSGLSRSILDAAFGEFRRQLDYKTQWYGSALTVVDRFFPSSKVCSRCGSVKATLNLQDRVYVCDHCGLVLNRDVNAARNLVEWAPDRSVASGAGETLNARGENVSLTSNGEQSSVKREDHRQMATARK